MLNSEFVKIQKICRCIVSSTSMQHIEACKNLVLNAKLDKTSTNHLEELLNSQRLKVEASY